MGRRRRSRSARFLRRHPIVILAMFSGGAGGYGIDRWLDVTDRAQLVVSVVIAALVLLGRLLLGIGYGAIYVLYGWLPEYNYQREGCIYVGKTRQYPADKRIKQHLYGSSHFGTAEQAWSDTVTRWRLAHESRYMTNVGLHLRELVNIRIRRPRYNYMMNLGNSRRIPKYVAADQRAERDAMRWAA